MAFAPLIDMTRIRWLRLLLVFAFARADVYHYHLNLGAYGTQTNLRYRQSGMFSHNDAPSKTAPGNGHSYIDFGDLEFQVMPGELSMAYPGAVTYVEVAVFESSHFSELGVTVAGAAAKQYCCTPWVENRTGCNPSRGLIRTWDESKPTKNGTIEIIRIPVPLTPGKKVKLKHAGFEQLGHAPYSAEGKGYKVRQSGLYSLLLANCDATNALDVLVTGETKWLNPYGYLPGEIYGMMPFFGVMASIYFVACAGWAVLCCWLYVCATPEESAVSRGRSGAQDAAPRLTELQRWISVVLVLGLVENSLKFGDYVGWNADGERNTGALAASLVFGVTKRALSRVLVVMTSLGYSVVKPSLGPQLSKVAALGLTYFMVDMAYDLLLNLPGSKVVDTASSGSAASVFLADGVTVLVLLLAAVDVVFYVWILQALVGTITYLERKKEETKLLLFRRFRVVLVTAFLFSVAWSLYTALASAQGYFESHWSSAWSVNAVWEVSYVLITVAIAVLWMPSKHAQRYAYSSQLKTFDPDEDGSGGDDDFDDTGSGFDSATNAHVEMRSNDHSVDAEYGGELDDGGGGGGGGEEEFPAMSISEVITGTKLATGGEKLT